MLRGFGRYSNHWIRMTFQRLQGLNDHQKRIGLRDARLTRVGRPRGHAITV